MQIHQTRLPFFAFFAYMIKKYFWSLLVAVLLYGCGANTNKPAKLVKLSAIDSVSQRIAVEPNNHQLLADRAKLLMEQNDFMGAKIDIAKAIYMDSTVGNYYTVLADVYMGLKQPAGARFALEKCVEIDPNNVEGLNKLAEFNMFLGEFKETISLADRALKIDVHNAHSYFIKGFAFMESGDTIKAISSMQTATEQDPDYYDAYMQLGLLFSAKHNTLAVNYFDNASKLRPNSTEVYYGLAMYYQENGKPDKAVEVYKLLLKLDPKYAEAHYNMGFISFKIKRNYEEAIQHFTNAVAANPKMAKAPYMRGLCYEALKQPDKAKTQYAYALQLDSSYALAAKANKRLLGVK